MGMINDDLIFRLCNKEEETATHIIVESELSNRDIM